MADRREEILDATFTCLLRNGLAALSTTAICEEAGISMGALYTHFRTKDDIILALAERNTARRREDWTFESAEALRQGLSESIGLISTMAAAQGFRVDLELISASFTDERLRDALAPFRDNFDLMDSLSTLEAAGHLKPGVAPETAAAAFEALILGFRLLDVTGGKYGDARMGALKLLFASVMET